MSLGNAHERMVRGLEIYFSEKRHVSIHIAVRGQCAKDARGYQYIVMFSKGLKLPVVSSTVPGTAPVTGSFGRVRT